MSTYEDDDEERNVLIPVHGTREAIWNRTFLKQVWPRVRLFVVFATIIVLFRSWGGFMSVFMLVLAVVAAVVCLGACEDRYARATCGRVKCIDFHGREPWIIASFYAGSVTIWNIEKPEEPMLSVQVSSEPVRCVKFVEKRDCFATGSDDMYVRVYKNTTAELVREFQAHSDYIRSIEVHPMSPYLLTGSDDMTIRQWDMESRFALVHEYRGHSHYVMQVKMNPQNANMFASASLDRSINIWILGSEEPDYTLEGHDGGVNCIDFCSNGDKPCILSGSDDQTVKLWDYESRSIVCSFQGHEHNVNAVLCHPILPIFVSTSEDGIVRIWHSGTFQALHALDYGTGRGWALAAAPPSDLRNLLAIGFDRGCVYVNLDSRNMETVEFLGKLEDNEGINRNSSATGAHVV